MNDPKIRLSTLAAALLLAFGAHAQTTATSPTAEPVPLSAGQVRVAQRFAAPFATFAGSQENAVALATALRTGTAATLTYTTVGPNGATTTTTTTIEPPTRPMGWGNVSHALALAQYSLTQAGLTNPTGAEINAALLGGSVTVDGTAVELTGVLAQRASGMGWGTIARSYGTTMGAVNRTLRTGTTVASTGTSPSTQPRAVYSTATGTTASGDAARASRATMTTAAGTTTAVSTGRGVTTAGGTAAGGKGLTTAAGASGGKAGGIVTAEGASARGQGAAQGRGIVTASGGGAVTSAAHGASGSSSGVVTAAGANGGGASNAHGGRGGGGGGDGTPRGKPGG